MRAYPHEDARVAGASERVGGREGSRQNAWCGQKGAHSMDSMGDRKEKSSEFTRRDFEDKGYGEQNPSAQYRPLCQGNKDSFAPCVAE